MNIDWSRRAIRDLADAWDYVALDSEAAADRLLALLTHCVERLASHPRAGREGRIKNTRELVLPGAPYVIAYRIKRNDDIEILRVLHGRRRWPEHF